MTDASWHLPCPDSHPEFYADVTTKRLLAWVVDIVVVLVLTLLTLPLTAFLGLLVLPIMVMTISFIYRVATLSNRSATWGMRVMGIELRAASGDRLDFAGALAHTTGYAISIAMPLIQAGSILLMLTSPRGQGLSDHALGTAMVNCRRG